MFSRSDDPPHELDLHAFSNWTDQYLQARLLAGERFVVYHYAVSVIFYSFRHPTRVYVQRSRRHAVLMGLPWTLLTALLGWWSFPAGPVFTIQCLAMNLRGGEDVSGEILDHIRKHDVRYQYGLR